MNHIANYHVSVSITEYNFLENNKKSKYTFSFKLKIYTYYVKKKQNWDASIKFWNINIIYLIIFTNI